MKKQMTPEERAEKIITELFYWWRANGKPVNDLKEAVADQIRMANADA